MELEVLLTLPASWSGFLQRNIWVGASVSLGMARAVGLMGEAPTQSLVTNSEDAEDVPGHCRGVGLDGLERSLPMQTIP